MDINQAIIPIGRRNRPGYKIKPRYITEHNTPGQTGKALSDYANGTAAAARPASWHFSVGADGIWQNLPLDENGWHAGDGWGPGNMQSIGIEMVHPTPPALFEKTVDLGAQLTAWLLDTLNLEVADVRQHWHWTGKNCPMYLRAGEAGGWDGFIAKVAVYLSALRKPETWFEETKQWIHEEFYAAWKETGGLAINGYPIAPATGDPAVCAKYGPDVRMIQYVERTRFEKHVDAEGHVTIMRGLLGVEALKGWT